MSEWIVNSREGAKSKKINWNIKKDPVQAQIQSRHIVQNDAHHPEKLNHPLWNYNFKKPPSEQIIQVFEEGTTNATTGDIPVILPYSW